MSTNDKILIGSTIALAVSAVLISSTAKKYVKEATNINNSLSVINTAQEKMQNDITLGNTAIIEGNNILKDILKNTMPVK